MTKTGSINGIILMLSISLASLVLTASGEEQTHARQPQVPIRFNLKEPGFVTLVIEDLEGKRVRNLISETSFPAGENIAWWDGLDDIGRDETAARLAYHIPGERVAPGKYRARGLARPQLDLTYEMTPYSAGDPPWRSADSGSGWLYDHAAPSTVLFLPEADAPPCPGKSAAGGQIVVSSCSGDGGGLVWLDLEGRKLRDQTDFGVTHMARDEGAISLARIYAYTASVCDNELRLHMLATSTNGAAYDATAGEGEDFPVLSRKYKFPNKLSAAVGGLAIRNGLLVVSLPRLNQLLFVDAVARMPIGTAPLDDPRGLAFDKEGQLLAISGKQLLRFALATNPTNLPAPRVLATHGLDHPQQMALDADGNIYVSNRGDSHQVKVFNPRGKLIRKIGTAGKPNVGRYDPEHMNNPGGITISGDGHLWVAEEDKTPKRVSVWTLKGKLVKAFYGPPKSGGGGCIHPLDKTRFFYAEDGGMEFKLNWEKGAAELTDVYYRPEYDTLRMSKAFMSNGRPPQTPIQLGKTVYLTDAHNVSPVCGASVATIWMLRGGVAVPVAAVGAAHDWSIFGGGERFSARWTGRILPLYSEKYSFVIESDDGARLWVDGKQIIDNWNTRGPTEAKGDIELAAGRRCDIKMEYFHADGNAVVKLYWKSASQQQEIIPQAQLFPTADAGKGQNGNGSGLTAQYYGDQDLRTLRHACINGTVNFDWGVSIPAALRSSGGDEFSARLPADANPGKDDILFAWSDLNADGQTQPHEITAIKADVVSVNVMPDLTVITGTAILLKPEKFTNNGVPVYDAGKATMPMLDAQRPTSSGGGQALLSRDGWVVLTTAPKPFAPQSVGGGKDGRALWSYPSLWPGLHASRIAPLPEFSGELIGTTRLLGNFVTPCDSDLGEIWALNGNKGNIYLFTADGLFVATLFKDSRMASWSMPTAAKGMSLNDASEGEECFWPGITQTADGEIYLVAGAGSIVRVRGLEKARRLPAQDVELKGR